MEKNEFIKQQFISIREEVKETKARIFKTMGFGLVIVPVAHFLAQTYHIDTITLSLPILVVVVALMFLGENNALMRCGRYIKYHIESEVNDTKGWETWLETKSNFDARAVDKYLSYAFYLLFFVYFAGSTFLAARFSLTEYGVIPTAFLVGTYIAIGIWFVIFLIHSIKISTSTKQDIDEN